MRRGLAALASARTKLHSGSLHLSNLRGTEGAAAAAYFEAFQTLFRTSLGFTGRNRRPPRNPVNVVLSLGYTLAYDESIRALASAGLDAFMPGFHDLAGTRAALACDVTEAARAEVDGWALTLFSKGHLGSADFRVEAAGACLLAKPARQMVYGQWAEKLQPLVRQHLEGAVAHYLQHLAPFRTAAIETYAS
jgi:CRISP-associated protein Cas1